MSAKRFTADFFVIAAVIVVALLLRAVPVYDQVFRAIGGEVRVVFDANDPWIHMRNADNAAAHFPPSPGWFDPYRLAPEGQWSEAPLMDWIIAGTAALLSGGPPAQEDIDRAGAWLPAVAGSLVVIPVFLLTLRLFDRRAARLAALLVAILPGQLLQRSMLGHPDHHVLEALLAALALRALMRAIQSTSRRDAGLAGVVLGAYLLAWSSGAFLILILLAAAFTIIAASVLWRKPSLPEARPLAIAMVVAALIALPSILRLPAMHLNLPLLLGGALTIVAAAAGCDRMHDRGWTRRRIASVATVLSVIIAGMLAAIPAVREIVEQYVVRLTPSAQGTTVGEARPLLMLTGELSLFPAWSELTTSALLLLGGLVVLAWQAWRTRSAASILFAVWSGAAIVATLSQARFGYYLAFTAAVLASGFAVRATEKLHRGFAIVILAAVVLYPNVPRLIATIAAPTLRPSNSWLEALDWLRTQTPEPFDDRKAYTTAYRSAESAPKPGYSVMVWWDFGYWVTRIGRRPPAANPTQAGASQAARFYLATDEREAARILESAGARYVIVDGSMPVHILTAGKPGGSQLEPMTRWAGVNPARMFELVRSRDARGTLRSQFIYYPDYYRTMATRLIAYEGRGWTPVNATWAVDVRDAVVDGHRLRILHQARAFGSYDEASTFVASDPLRWRIAGFDPMHSCVSLAPLQRFTKRMGSSGRGLVAIYEYR